MKALLKKIYQQLPVIRELVQIQKTAMELQATAKAIKIVQTNRYFKTEIEQNPKYADPRKLNHHEYQVFSQNGEDGIIAEIFRRIGIKTRYFVEFGTGDGLENNTAFLLTQGWRGAWIEGDGACINKIQSHFRVPLASGALSLRPALITAENINELFQELKVPAIFDLLSVDIDRNTFHVWQAIKQFQPRVVVVEYNATLPPDVEWTVDYVPDRGWNYSAYFGASLKAFERLAMSLGYSLVGCDLSGTNAFFIRNSEPLSLFAEPFTAVNHFEPPRYWAIRREAHRRAFGDD